MWCCAPARTVGGARHGAPLGRDALRAEGVLGGAAAAAAALAAAAAAAAAAGAAAAGGTSS